jgi:LPS-assembly lipoprotein
VNHRRHFISVALLTGLVLTSGCGFRLRGANDLKIASVYLNAPASSPLGMDVRRLLRANGVRTVESENAAEVILDIQNETREQTVLTFSPTGTAREIELRLRLQFRVRAPEGANYIDSKELTFRRELLVSEGQILPREYEQQALYRDMQSDAVQQIVRQMEFIRPAERKPAASGSTADKPQQPAAKQ